MKRHLEIISIALISCALLTACPAPTSSPAPAPAQASEAHPIAKQKIGDAHSWKYSDDPEFEVFWDYDMPKLYVKHSDGSYEFLHELKVLKKGTRLYRWVPQETAETIDQAGKVSAEYLDFKVNEISNNRHGGGIYASSNIFDSQTYGEHILIVDAEQDLLVASSNAFRADPRFITEKDIENAKNGNNVRQNRINRGLRHAGVHAIMFHNQE